MPRLARAASLPHAGKITPPSFRHAWNTISGQRGAALAARQFAPGDTDPRTTQQYDRMRESRAGVPPRRGHLRQPQCRLTAPHLGGATEAARPSNP